MSNNQSPKAIRTAPTTKDIRGEATKGTKPTTKPEAPKKNTKS